MFVHFLITRFNIVQDWYSSANRNNANIQSDEWLDERFRLFKQYCFPSVANQDTDNFVWFVLFNSETPEKYKLQISSFENECNIFKPLYLKPYGNENELVTTEIKKYLNEIHTHVITTRLDNDDMIRSDYISIIQNAFSDEYDDVFLNYATGYKYIENKKVLYAYMQEQGHYISRIVTRKNINYNVLVDHSVVASLADYQEIDTSSGPAWIETIHQCNAWNRLDFRIPVYINSSKFPNLNLSKKNYLCSLCNYYLSYTYKYIKRKIEKYIISIFVK